MVTHRSLALILVFLIVPVLAHAQDALPDAATVLNRYVEVTGGKAAYDRIHSRIVAATMEMPGQDLVIQTTQYFRASDRACLVSELAGMGSMSAGYVGDLVWTNNPMSGPKILDGKQAAVIRQYNSMDWLARWNTTLLEPKVVGKETLEGKECIEIEGKVADNDITLYFDVATGLLTRMDFLFPGFMGTSSAKYWYRDYKTVGGLTIPYQIRVVTGRQEMLLTVDSIQNNVEIPDSIFLPEEVRALSPQK